MRAPLMLVAGCLWSIQAHAVDAAQVIAEADEAMMESLRALGYVQ